MYLTIQLPCLALPCLVSLHLLLYYLACTFLLEKPVQLLKRLRYEHNIANRSTSLSGRPQLYGILLQSEQQFGRHIYLLYIYVRMDQYGSQRIVDVACEVSGTWNDVPTMGPRID